MDRFPEASPYRANSWASRPFRRIGPRTPVFFFGLFTFGTVRVIDRESEPIGNKGEKRVLPTANQSDHG